MYVEHKCMHIQYAYICEHIYIYIMYICLSLPLSIPPTPPERRACETTPPSLKHPSLSNFQA